eukprot:sb/3474246/
MSAMINGTYNKDNPKLGPKFHSLIQLVLIRSQSEQPIRTRYLGHVTGYHGYQPIRDQYFLNRSVPVVLGAKKDLRVVGYGMLDRIKKSAAQQGLLKVMAIENLNRPIRTLYLGHVTGYQPIRDQYFLVRSVPDWMNIGRD